MPIYGTYTPYDLERVQHAIDYIHAHYKENISSDQLAIEVELSKSLLQTLMYFITGMTVHHYLIKVRVDCATKCLADFKKSIKFIALTHGFSSSSHFSSSFKKQTGKSPNEYRLQLLRSEKSIA
jgi:transcriptional regulator GlxA family with amidase domain